MAIANKYKLKYIFFFIAGILFFTQVEPALAQTNSSTSIEVDTLWLIVAGSLIFFMNAGFAMLEAGLCQTRNATNVLAKNLIVFCVSVLAFWSVGFGLMFGDGNAWVGTTGWFFQSFTPPLVDSFNLGFNSIETLYPNHPWMVVFFLQLVFAGTTATIVSGAMAERVKFWAFFWFSFLLVALAYPLAGRWVWHPDGWLANSFNFLDYAGSTVVHSVGGMAGLVGTILIGPRRGWRGYNPDEVRGDRFSGSSQSFGYYNLSLASLGCLILWLGWLGFNGGAVNTVSDAPHAIMTTMLAGASGGVFVVLLRGLRSQKPGLPLVINGVLGGLVSITASSMYVSLGTAVLIGAVGSIWILLGEKLLRQFHIDDPVGAISVHLGCGIWGTLAAGLFANQLSGYIDRPIDRLQQIFNQIIGILAINGTILVLSLIFWLAIGFAIYAIESINRRLKYGAKKLDNQGNSRYQGWYKYLHYARSGIRVSQVEEAKGSDGTFS